jgi:hypothetical protein
VLNRSQDLFERGDVASVEASLRFARAALLLRPDFGLAHYHAAVCLEQQGHLADALHEAEQALHTSWWVGCTCGLRCLAHMELLAWLLTASYALPLCFTGGTTFSSLCAGCGGSWAAAAVAVTATPLSQLVTPHHHHRQQQQQQQQLVVVGAASSRCRPRCAAA